MVLMSKYDYKKAILNIRDSLNKCRSVKFIIRISYKECGEKECCKLLVTLDNKNYVEVAQFKDYKTGLEADFNHVYADFFAVFLDLEKVQAQKAIEYNGDILETWGAYGYDAEQVEWGKDAQIVVKKHKTV